MVSLFHRATIKYIWSALLHRATINENNMTTTLVAEKYSIRNTSTVELMRREMIHSLFDVLTEDNGREVSWSLTSLFSTNTAISETNNGQIQIQIY